MNDKIRELMLQAMVETGRLESVEATYQKFGELIIRECTTICDTIGREARKQWKTKYNPHDDGRSDGAWECEDAIKEHFGVE